MPHPVPQGRGWALHSPHHVPAAAFFHPSPPPHPQLPARRGPRPWRHSEDWGSAPDLAGPTWPTVCLPPTPTAAPPRPSLLQPPRLRGPPPRQPPHRSWSVGCCVPTACALAQRTPHTPTRTLLGWRRDGPEDELQLVGCGRAGEQGPPPQHLPQDAAQAPHVRPGGVPGAGAGLGEGRSRGRSGARGRDGGRGREALGPGWARGHGAPAAGGGDGIGWCQVTGWRTAAPLEPGTSVWPHTRSGPGPPAPRGGRGGGGRGRSHTASPGSRH